jgi:hypothetical protein
MRRRKTMASGNGALPPTAPAQGKRREASASPRPGAPVRPRGSTIAGIDIGTTKICCFIARVEAEPRITGIGHQIARGVRSGAIIDLDAAGDSIRGAVHAAE